MAAILAVTMGTAVALGGGLAGVLALLRAIQSLSAT